MTQLDLPPVSFARYLDLLRRRTWQVVPISLLGLVIGGLVAFFVPRYYVVTTVVRFNGNVVQPRGGDAEDPLVGEVASARTTIPARVPETLRKLGWPEVAAPDEQRIAFENAVRGRVEVTDLTGPSRGRSSMQLRLAYRDTNPRRAVQLTQTLRDLWLDSERTRLRDLIVGEQAALSARLRSQYTAVTTAETELRQFEELHGLDPNDFTASGRDLEQNALAERLKAKTDALALIDARIEAAKRELRSKRLEFESTPQRIVSEEKIPIPPDLEFALTRAQITWLQLEERLANWTPANPQYNSVRQMADTAKAEYERIAAALDQVRTTEVENKQYGFLQSELRRIGNEIADAEAQRESLQTEIRKLQREKQERPGLYEQRRKIELGIEVLKAQVIDLEKEREGLESKVLRLQMERPYEVVAEPTMPARPTEPDILLVALTGSLIGLAAAIGIVLLLDVMQSSFKTVDDVAHGLPVPVLGSLSHMETVERRLEVSRRRRTISIVVAIFAALVVTIVILYYSAPTSLPPFLVRMLDVVLGTAGGK